MLTFNKILHDEGIDPAEVRLVRHQDKRVKNRLYKLWLTKPGDFELYQRIQNSTKVFPVGCLLASFVVTPMEETLFVGLYRVHDVRPRPPEIVDPAVPEESGRYLYDVRREDKLTDYIGHLIVDWGPAKRVWVQLGHKRDKQVLEIRRELREEPFPGFTYFCWDIDEIDAVPFSWQTVLKNVKGVYLLVCKETGKQYVGSAKGEESLWGRFCNYYQTGHGGNVELKCRGRKSYKVTVLEIVNSDEKIESVENAWMRKLMTREFGLNLPKPENKQRHCKVA